MVPYYRPIRKKGLDVSAVFTHRRAIAWIAAAAVSIVAGYSTLYVVQNGFGGSLALLVSGGDYSRVSGATIMLAAVVAALLGTFAYQAAMNRFSVRVLKAYEVVYLLAVSWVVLFKSPGVSGVNLNPLDVISQAQEDPASLAANLLLLAPLGFILRAHGKRVSRVAIVSFLFSLEIEAVQLIFSLGVFDIVDLMANTVGAVLGGLFCEEASVRIERTQVGKGAIAFHRHPVHEAAGRCAWAGVALLVVTVMVAVATLMPSVTADSVDLQFVPTGSIATLEPSGGDSPEGDGTQPSSSGMTVRDNGSVDMRGRCDLGASWMDAGGATCLGVSVVLGDTVRGDGVVLPVVVLSDTAMTIGGERVAIDELEGALSERVGRGALLTVTPEDGWLRAISLELDGELSKDSSREDTASGTVQESFPWASYGSLESFGSNTEGRDMGYVSSFTQIQGESFVTVCTIGSYCGAPIIFVKSYPVGKSWSPGTVDLGSPGSPVDVGATSLESLLIL